MFTRHNVLTCLAKSERFYSDVCGIQAYRTAAGRVIRVQLLLALGEKGVYTSICPSLKQKLKWLQKITLDVETANPIH